MQINTSNLAMLATKQWGSRPDDERFWSVDECLEAARSYRALSVELPDVDESKLRVQAEDGDLMLIGKGGVASSFTNWSFSQMTKALKCPEGFVSELPATLAAQVLNHRLSVRAADESLGTNLLFYSNGHHVVRAFTSAKYGRVWDTEVLEACKRLTDRGWKVPPARPASDSARTRQATQDDVVKAGNLSLSIKVGDTIAPAGVYRGDRDLFVILVDDTKAIELPGQSPLFRAAMFRNSEVGAAYWEVYFILINGICGNHILHGVQGVKYVRTAHVGTAEERAAKLFSEKVIPYANAENWGETYGQVRAAQRFMLGAGKPAVIEGLFEKGVASKAVLERAYTRAEQHEGWYGDPNSAWGMTNGLTEIAQETPHADKRLEVELAGAKVLELAF